MTRDENLSRISICLVEPQDCQNIGSVCRAAKTMGINSLIIAGRTEFDTDRVRQLAVHAYDLFENCRIFPTLSQALADSSFSVAFTRRNGKFRKLSFFTLDELSSFISAFPDGKVTLVFGRESNGLTDSEVALCNSVCTIETSQNFPSLNLAQAVQIACYSLFSSLNDYSISSKAVDGSRIGIVRDRAVEALDGLHFFKEASDEKKNYEIFIKDYLSRGHFSESEICRIEKFFDKIYHIAKYGGKK